MGNARNTHFTYSNLFCPFPLLIKGEEALGVWNGKEKSGGKGPFPVGAAVLGGAPVSQQEWQCLSPGMTHNE